MRGPNVDSMRRFNDLHVKMRVVIEDCFGRLTGRWRVLRMICAHPDLAACVQDVCVALHNFGEARDVAYEGEDEEGSSDDSVVDVEWTASDQAAYAVGCARRVEIVRALCLPWVDGEYAAVSSRHEGSGVGRKGGWGERRQGRTT